MQSSTMVHYICSPSILNSLARYAAFSNDLAKGRMTGSLLNLNLEQWVDLISYASQSDGRLRLFLKDGRELRARSLTEEMMREVFHWANQNELLAAIDQLKQAVGLPLKSKTGLFAPLEHSAP